MKVARKHLIVGLIGNLLVFIIGLIGVLLIFTEKPEIPAIFKYFTVISNLLVVLISGINSVVYLASVINDKNYVKEIFQILKLVAVTMCLITFLMVLIFLLPADPSYGWFSGSQLFLHLLTPTAAVISFVFLEYGAKMRFRFFFVPAVAVILYGVFYTVYAKVAPAGEAVDWYGFLFDSGNRIAPVDFSKIAFGQFFIFLAESLGGALVFGFGLWLLNKIMNLIFVGYVLEEDNVIAEVEDEPAPVKEESEEYDEEQSKEEKEVAKAKKTAKTSKAKVAPSKKYNGGVRVYHISRSKFVSKKWQVKLASGEKAIKLFDTQLEAINYAKGLVKKQGGSIRIHSMKGQLRK